VSAKAVVFAPGALDDFRSAVLWYREHNRAAADSFRAAVYEAAGSLAETSNHRAADDEGNRRRLLKKFPYSLIYELGEDTITVLAVAHHRRRPGYWRRP
jgi:plasmid stabilization system protein ParE